MQPLDIVGTKRTHDSQIIFVVRDSNLTLIYGDIGIPANMTIHATTIDRT